MIKRLNGAFILCTFLYITIALSSHAVYGQYNSSNSGNQTYSTKGATGQIDSTQGQSPPATSQGNVYGQGPVTSSPPVSSEERKPPVNSRYVKTYKIEKAPAAEKSSAQENSSNGSANNTTVHDVATITDTTTIDQTATYTDVAPVNAGDNSCSCTSRNIAFGLLAASLVGLIILLSLYLNERKGHHNQNTTKWKAS